MRVRIFNHEIEIDMDFIEEDKDRVRKQLEEYISDELNEFNLSIRFPSSFTGRVMEEMSKIPYGETRTYGEIAESLDTSPIAVGQACGRNPVPVIVPCHRVVAKNSTGGFRYGQDLKEKLLAHESTHQDLLKH